MTNEERMTELEMMITDMQKIIDDLNAESVRQAQVMMRLEQECKNLRRLVDEGVVKPLSEETPPPHY